MADGEGSQVASLDLPGARADFSAWRGSFARVWNHRAMIVVRRARMFDLPFLRRLTLETVTFGIPEGRDIPNAEVKKNVVPYLDDLEVMLHRKQDVAVLVAVDDEREDRPVGFLILEFNHVEHSTGEPQSFIANLAVEPDYWGKYVGSHMVREAAKVSGQKGYRYMTSQISASNRRTVMQALWLGFEIERFQMTMACTPEGNVKMPGRPLQERAHALSRLPQGRRQGVKRKPKSQSGESS